MFIKILFVFMLFLSGCQSSLSSSSHFEAENPRESTEGEIISISDHSMLIAYENTLATLSFDNATQSFSVGDIVEISYDDIQETYPTVLTNPTLELKEKGDNRVEMIFNVISELYETDPGLNGEITFIALDLTEFDFLSESQKNACCYLIESKFNYPVLQTTMKELIEQGLAEELSIPEGILITLKTAGSTASKLEFSCMKYRSGLGAIFFSESQAQLKNHEWIYELGGFSIS